MRVRAYGNRLWLSNTGGVKILTCRGTYTYRGGIGIGKEEGRGDDIRTSGRGYLDTIIKVYILVGWLVA